MVVEQFDEERCMNIRFESGEEYQGKVIPPDTRIWGRKMAEDLTKTSAFVQLQRRLTQDKLRAIDDIQQAVRIRQAAREAEALSWQSGFPLLLFPVLFDEKAAAAIREAIRQAAIYERSRELLGLSVKSQ